MWNVDRNGLKEKLFNLKALNRKLFNLQAWQMYHLEANGPGPV